MTKSVCVIRVDEISGFNTMFDYLFYDIGKEFPYEIAREKRELTPFRYKVLNSIRFKKLTGGRFNSLLRNAYELSKELKKQCAKYEHVIVIFTNNCFIHTNIPYEALKKIKNCFKNSTWVLFYLDQIDKGQCKVANQLRKYGLFDLTYTYDHRDACKNGFISWNTPYSKLIDKEVSKVDNSLYFCGTNPKLFSSVSSIVKECEKEQVAYSMDIVSYPENCQVLREYKSICIKSPNTGFFDYDDLLHKAVNSNCILELVQDGFGLTIRPYEAICYNKKLLTNNKTIFSFPYYDPEFIQFFESVEDIDWEWVKKESVVDYKYNGEYSPIKLVEDILNRI